MRPSEAPAEKGRSFREHSTGRQRGALAEFLHFVIHNKKWWLTPILVLVVVLGVLVVLGGTGVAPFIYSLF